MTEIAGLIRQFPEGTFFLLISLVWACERVGVAIAGRNRPLNLNCSCSCCDEVEDTDDDEEED